MLQHPNYTGEKKPGNVYTTDDLKIPEKSVEKQCIKYNLKILEKILQLHDYKF